MKHLLMVQNGVAGLPHSALQDCTALEAMRGTHLRLLAEEGATGYLKVSRNDSDLTAHFLAQCCGVPRTIAGKIPMGPLTALALGLAPADDAVMILGQFFVSESNGQVDAIELNSMAEHQKLVEDLGCAVRETVSATLQCLALSQGRFLLVAPGLEKPKHVRIHSPLVTVDPDGSSRLRSESTIRKALSAAMEAVLADHPVNQVRLDLGENPVSGAWLWGEGSLKDLAILRDPQQEDSCMVSSDLFAQGLGHALGMKVLPCDALQEEEGRLDAAFDVGKLIQLLDQCERVVVYIPPPFRGRPEKTPQEQVRRLDAVDYYFTGPLRSILEKNRPCRMIVVAGGFRRDSLPEKGKVPVLIWGDGVEADASRSLSEREMLSGSLGLMKPGELLEFEQRK